MCMTKRLKVKFLFTRGSKYHLQHFQSNFTSGPCSCFMLQLWQRSTIDYMSWFYRTLWIKLTCNVHFKLNKKSNLSESKGNLCLDFTERSGLNWHTMSISSSLNKKSENRVKFPSCCCHFQKPSTFHESQIKYILLGVIVLLCLL